MRERIVTELSPPPTASSIHRPWSGMTVQLHDWQSGGSVNSPAVDHDMIAMRLTGNVRLTQYRAGNIHRARVGPGNVTIHARGFESRWSWDRPGAIVIVRASQEVLAQSADVAIKRGGAIELQNCFGTRDVFIEPILNLLTLELRRPPHPVQELISGCLSAALAGHLVQRFNVHRTISASDPGGLEPHSLRRVVDYVQTLQHAPLTLATLAGIAEVSPFHFARRFRRSTGQGLLEYLASIGLRGVNDAQPSSGLQGGLAFWQVRRVTSYMLDRLDAEVSLDELAKLVHLSRAHFCTAFRLSVGQTPREWLIARRLEHARELLAHSNMSITEIALALGYTPSAFGAIFRERVGVTPSAFRRAL